MLSVQPFPGAGQTDTVQLRMIGFEMFVKNYVFRQSSSDSEISIGLSRAGSGEWDSRKLGGWHIEPARLVYWLQPLIAW